MDIILELYATLIFTLLGFVLPILSILISFFPEGTRTLTSKYENEKKQSEDNILNEIDKRKSDTNLDYVALGKTLKTLKRNKRKAENRLSYLRPLGLIIKVFLPLALALSGIILALVSYSYIITVISLILSLAGFLRALYVLWRGLQVVVEVAEVVNESKKNSENRVIELLSALVEKSGNENLFLKSEKIAIKFDEKIVEEKKAYTFSVNKKHEVSISIVNTDDRMAKNVELGFIFPLDFLIEKTPNISSIYIGENQQIVRFKQEFIQANENNLQGKISVTFLKIGEFNVDTFIKGENVEK